MQASLRAFVLTGLRTHGGQSTCTACSTTNNATEASTMFTTSIAMPVRFSLFHQATRHLSLMCGIGAPCLAPLKTHWCFR